MTQQSKAFRIIFITQLFQSLSHFGLKAIVILYFVQALGWSDSKAYAVFGAFMSLLCIIPVLGGYLTDHWLGHKKSILYGGMIICCGHICMTFGSQAQLFLGLAFITLGTGLMLPALCSLVGVLYENNTEERDRAFNWYYMAVNVGGIGAGLLVGSVAHWVGWHAGFGIAAIGMFIALLLISSQWSLIEQCIPNKQYRGIPPLVVLLLSAAIVLSIWWCYSHIDMVKWIVLSVALIVLVQYCYLAYQAPVNQRRGLGILSLVLLLSLGYLVLYELSGTSIVLFTERVIDRHLFSWQVPTPVLQALNPFYIILFAPMMSEFWSTLKRRNLEPSTLSKLGLGIFISSSGFLILSWVSSFTHPSITWLIAVMALLTFSELFVGPVSLSAISDLAPKSLSTSMMGIWFLTGSIAAYLSALLANLTSATSAPSHQAYGHVFHMVGIDGVIIGFGVVAMVALWRRLTSNNTQPYQP